MSRRIKTKDGSVWWKVHPAIDAVQDVIIKAYSFEKAVAVVTSAKDGTHSQHSAHHQLEKDPEPAWAIDLRIWNLFRAVADKKKWWQRLYSFAGDLSIKLNDAAPKGFRFIVLLEDDHIHVEAYPEGGAPNLKGFKPLQTVYATEEVQGSMT